MRRLLENSTESFYWLGFIFADGWFDFKKNTIGVMLSENDREHLNKLCNFLDSSVYEEETNGEYGRFKMVKTLKRDSEVFSLITERYGIIPQKTYNPPTCLISELDNLPNDLFLSFVVGFFDGDGSVVSVPTQNSLTMRFQNHVRWKFLLDYFETRTYAIFKYKKFVPLVKTTTTHNGNKTATLTFARFALINDFSTKIKALNLPVLTRKWDKVNTFLEARQQKLSDGQKKATRNKRWLDNEVNILRETMYNLTAVEIQKRFFEHRTISSVNQKIQLLKRSF